MADVTRACEYCGTDLGQCHWLRKYCGNSCKNSALWRKHNPRTPAERCAWCDTKMVGKKPHAVYCTRRCKSFASHARRGRSTPEENKARYQREKKRRKQYAVDRYWEDPEAGRQYSRQWRKENPEKRQIQHQRRRALLLACAKSAVTAELWQQKCAYWGDKCYLQIPGRCTGAAETMDHVKPLSTKSPSAHMLANLRPACKPCNSSKNDKWPYKVPFVPTK